MKNGNQRGLHNLNNRPEYPQNGDAIFHIILSLLLLMCAILALFLAT